MPRRSGRFSNLLVLRADLSARDSPSSGAVGRSESPKVMAASFKGAGNIVALRGFLDKIVIPEGDGLLQVVGNFGSMLAAAQGRSKAVAHALRALY